MSVATEVGDYINNKNTSMFTQDYKYEDAFICYECDNSIKETIGDYYLVDLEKKFIDDEFYESVERDKSNE